MYSYYQVSSPQVVWRHHHQTPTVRCFAISVQHPQRTCEGSSCSHFVSFYPVGRRSQGPAPSLKVQINTLCELHLVTVHQPVFRDTATSSYTEILRRWSSARQPGTQIAISFLCKMGRVDIGKQSIGDGKNLKDRQYLRKRDSMGYIL